MICDAAGPVAMGGVFGGQDSGITDNTVNIFLESAWFAPDGIRRSSLHHGLRTDAATHFEKGADINNVIPALLRAAQLISDIAGGTLYQVQDIYAQPIQEKIVTVRCSFIRKLNGKNYSTAAILNILNALGFGITVLNEDELQLTVPTNKADVSQPADIAEEILRIDGLDNVEIPDRLNITLSKPMPNDRKRQERLSGLLCGMGLQEIITNSIVNSKYYPGEESLVKMINSLTSELDCMRPSMLESGLEVVAYNCNRKNTDLALFEFGNVYHTSANGQYVQQRRLAIWITGNVRQTHWNEPAGACSIYHLKGILNNLREWDGIRGIAASVEGSDIVWKWKNEELCRAGKVSKEKCAALGIKQDVYFASVNWDKWIEAGKQVKTQFTAVPRFPSVQRDLALILDKQVTFQQVEEVTTKLKIAELQTWGLFDVFESDKLGAGKKSWALNFTFQPGDRTLTDEETNVLMKRLTEAYIAKLNATIRE
jgi:phenylalanyl-tRNA synthetase beta chain